MIFASLTSPRQIMQQPSELTRLFDYRPYWTECLRPSFRVAIIVRPDWINTADFMQLGRPNLCYGVAAGNMDSMINRHATDKKSATMMPAPLATLVAAP